MKFVLSSLALALLGSVAWAADLNAGFSDGIDRNDPKFIRASVLVMSPGEELFSCVGHTAIRLECPTFKKDYCFTYESERAVERLPAFFAGKLMMGMFAMPTAEMLKEYEEAGRGVWQYELQLPPDVKQRLWKHLDLTVTSDLVPYDYIHRGCAKAVLDSLRAACAPLKLNGPKPRRNIREIFWQETRVDSPWNIFFILGIGGTESDVYMEAGTPRELVRFLRGATLGGQPVLATQPVELLPLKKPMVAPAITPIMVASAFAGLVALAVWRRWRPVKLAVLALQALLGLFFIYLVTASALPTSNWNWLLVPFNPLLPALVLWKRVKWVPVVYALALTAWIAAYLFVPHMQTAHAYLVMVFGLALLYGELGWSRLRK